MGCVVKQLVCGVAGVAAARVRHVTIMPCFDKKLEASREDFTHPDTGVKEVDCVLTTLEVGVLQSFKRWSTRTFIITYHGEGSYYGILLVKSSHYCFYI